MPVPRYYLLPAESLVPAGRLLRLVALEIPPIFYGWKKETEQAFLQTRNGWSGSLRLRLFVRGARHRDGICGAR